MNGLFLYISYFLVKAAYKKQLVSQYPKHASQTLPVKPHLSHTYRKCLKTWSSAPRYMYSHGSGLVCVALGEEGLSISTISIDASKKENVITVQQAGAVGMLKKDELLHSATSLGKASSLLLFTLKHHGGCVWTFIIIIHC